MALKGKPIAIGTSSTTVYTCPASTEASVHGLVFYNSTGSAVNITLQIFTQSTNATTTLLTNYPVSATSFFSPPKPINLGAGDIIKATGSATGVIGEFAVFEDSSSLSGTLTPRGAWNNSANYVKNDIVSYATNGNSYLAIQSNNNSVPTTTSNWLVLAEKGSQGDVSLNTSQTLTNKTLTSPVINSGTINTATLVTPTINDAFIEEVHTANSGSSITLDLANGSIQRITLTASTTITMPTATAGKSFLLYAIQDGTGSRTITWSSVKWNGGVAPTLTTTASYWDIFQFVADGSNWSGWVLDQNYN